jgi:hypothetical protein
MSDHIYVLQKFFYKSQAFLKLDLFLLQFGSMYLKIPDILATCFLTPEQGWQSLGKWQEDHSSVPERQVSFPKSMGKTVNICIHRTH